jgi:CRP/FNR family transcriptional regulator, cyclic AMP receptor protein
MATPRILMLQGMPIFGALRDDVLAFLLTLMIERQVRAGDCIFAEGDSAASLFVLEDGEVGVFKGWTGRETRLGRFGPGDCFGEMSVMDLMPRSATVRADTDVRLLELTQDHLALLWQHDREQFTLLQMNLGREVSRRLRKSDELLFQLKMAHEWGPDFSIERPLT